MKRKTQLNQMIAIDEVLDPMAQKAIIDFDQKITKITSETIKIYNISEIKNEKYVGLPVALLGTISRISDAFPIQINETQRVTAYKIEIEDENNNQIECLTINHSNFIDNIRNAQKHQQAQKFVGTVVSVIDAFSRGYFFYLTQITENPSPMDRVKSDQKDTKKIKEIIAKTKKDKIAITSYIKNTLIKNLGIKDLETAKDLNVAIDFMILQSFSRGLSRDGRYSNKLHSLVIGSPAVGKKLLTEIAKILNPVAYEVTSTTGKLTAAGLVGNVKIIEGQTISKPGYLPLASGGVLCIQDFHEITKNKNNISSILSKVMEDGEVIDSTSARTTHKADTAIHIDMNRMSQVDPSKEYTSYTDLGLPINIISRFDFIIDIPPDSSRQLHVMLEMAKGRKILESNEVKSDTPKWEKDLRCLVAYLQTYFSEVEIPEEESKYFREKLQEFAKANLKFEDIQNHLSGMLTRLEISLEKILKALACSKMKKKISRTEIDEAFRFVQGKLHFLSTIDTIEVPTSRNEKKEKRKKIILEVFSGKTISGKEALEEINTRNSEKIDLRTIQRYFTEMEAEGKAKKTRKGRWDIQ